MPTVLRSYVSVVAKQVDVMGRVLWVFFDHLLEAVIIDKILAFEMYVMVAYIASAM